MNLHAQGSRKILPLILICIFGFGHVKSAHASQEFGLDDVAAMAKKLAAERFSAPPSVPDFLKQLSYDQYRDIRFETEQSLWKDRGNFQIQFLHPGLYYDHPVTINVYDRTGVHKVEFSPRLFNYGRNKFKEKIPPNLGFAGFRVAYPLHKKSVFNHVLVFAGASYFRAVGKDNGFGLSARGLAIDTGLPTGEEFPFFKEFWLERPSAKAREMKIFGLLDSQRVTGAYEFVLRPGEITTVSVRAKLFGRAPVKELGIAPLTSMFFYGEATPRPAGEWRPEVHDSDGLLIHSGTGEWIWRPLGNPPKLRLSYFSVENPKGFGLLQRDRDFDHYQDLETRHELRPNAWVVPAGNWGMGQVKLVEIPSQKETNDNIVAYWLFKDASISAQKSLDIAYRIEWDSIDPVEDSLGYSTAMRIGDGDKKEWKRIIVDFQGSKIKSLPANAPVHAMISLGPDGRLVQQSLVKNPVTQGWRLSFQVEAPKEKPLELRAFLTRQQEPLTETWSYQLEP